MQKKTIKVARKLLIEKKSRSKNKKKAWEKDRNRLAKKKSKLRLVRMREKQKRMFNYVLLVEKFAFLLQISFLVVLMLISGPKEQLVKNAVFRYSPAVTKGLNLQKSGKYRIPLFFSFSCFQSPLRRRLIWGVTGNKNMERIISRQRPDSPPPLQGTLSQSAN